MLITDSQFKGPNVNGMESKGSLMDRIFKFLSVNQDMVKNAKIRSRMVVMAGTGITLMVGVFMHGVFSKKLSKTPLQQADQMLSNGDWNR